MKRCIKQACILKRCIKQAYIMKHCIMEQCIVKVCIREHATRETKHMLCLSNVGRCAYTYT